MLEELTREYSHPFGIEQARALDEVLAHPEAFASGITGIADALPGWPKVRLDGGDAALARVGGRPLFNADAFGAPFCEGMRALLLDEDAKALALAESVAATNGTPVWALVRGLWNP
jgi:tRNA pseudouridine55 synthase